MKEKSADETSLKLLSEYDIYFNKTFILHVMNDFEYFPDNNISAFSTCVLYTYRYMFKSVPSSFLSHWIDLLM